MDNRSEDTKAIEKFINLGCDISGRVSGAAIGFLTGGFEGALLGGATGSIFTHLFREIGNEVIDRLLGSREKVRIGAVAAFAISKVQENLSRGRCPRDDGFFNDGDNRSTAEEISEGVFQAAQKEYEEKKIKYLGNLLGNIAFTPNVTGANANFLIRTAQDLTYRQFCILALIPMAKFYTMRPNDYRGSAIPLETIPILYEITALYNQGLINFGGEVLFGPTDVNPAKMKMQGIGADLYNLMELASIPQSDTDEVAKYLR